MLCVILQRHPQLYPSELQHLGVCFMHIYCVCHMDFSVYMCAYIYGVQRFPTEPEAYHLNQTACSVNLRNLSISAWLALPQPSHAGLTDTYGCSWLFMSVLRIWTQVFKLCGRCLTSWIISSALPCFFVYLILKSFRNTNIRPGMVTHAFNPSL